MRPEKRINTFLNVLGKQWKKLGSHIPFTEFLFRSDIPNKDSYIPCINDDELIKTCFPDVDISIIDFSKQKVDKFMKILGDVWKRQGIDLRFGQFMFNNGVQVFGGMEYHLEEYELLNKWFPEIDPTTYMYWGTSGKDGKSKRKYILIKDMETDHIENVLANVPRMSTQYRNVFKQELEDRKNGKKH